MKRILNFLAVLILALSLAPAQAKLARGGGSLSQAGFFPAGHWIVSPISSAVLPVFPLADSVTSATAREHQAYWDGTNDVEYDVVMGDEFGAYPYVCTLVQGPPGMTVAQSIYTTFQNANYCRVTWHPQGNISSAWNGEVEIAVTDQTHATIDMSWALWTVGQYSTSSFSAAYSVSGSTLTITGSCTGSLTPGTVVSDGANFPAGTYVAFDLSGTGCDGTYALNAAPGGTPSGTVTGAYGGGAVFVSPSGSGSTCSFSVPCSLTQAFGATFAATSYPGAIAYAAGGTYSSNSASFTGTISGTTMTVASGLTGTLAIGQNCAGPGSSAANGTAITAGSGTSWTVSVSQTLASSTIVCSTVLPAYTDSDTSSPGFEAQSSKKPNALIGLPGQTVILDASANQTPTYVHLIQLGTHGADWYMENITANSYNNAPTNSADQLIIVSSNRATFDEDSWTNSGYGSGTSGNMSFFVSGGNQTSRNYLFITDTSEVNRESGTPGNNAPFCDLYSWNYVLLQRNVENSPTSNTDGGFGLKSDITYSTMRENLMDVAGAVNGFSFIQSQYSGIGNNEVDYNLGVNVLAMWVGNLAFTWQSTAEYRNTLVAGSGLGISLGDTSHNLEGPGGPGLINATSVAGGSLTAGTSYTWGITSLGVSGESSTTIGSFGGTTGIAGSTNRIAMTIAAGDGSAQLTWAAEPGTTGYNGYRELTSCGGGTGCWTQYSLGNVTSWTDTGAAGTAADPPANPGTALSAARFTFYGNAFQTTNATPPPPSGTTITAPAYPTSLFNVVDGGSASALICISSLTGTPSAPSGCTTSGQQVGDLNTIYSGTYGTYAALAGIVGYKIQ